MTRSLAVLTGGHPFDEDAFDALLGRLGDWSITHLHHPEAEQAVAEGAIDSADAVLFYDMPGYDFDTGVAIARPPSPEFRERLRARFTSGRGAVAMHHAIAGWAAWPEWSEWIGGRFLYTPGTVRGVAKPDSGYRHDVEYTAEVVAQHPVTDGLPDQFEMCDELYLAEIFEGDVEPLVRARHSFTRDNFYSAKLAVAGKMFSNEGWDHDEGSNLVAWASRAIAAPLIYLQFGDGPAAYENPAVLKILANALEFVASPPKT
ncbi:ThuA domain-containing protein [Tsuneonella mangrovi]|uniref:ThuA domain-containing protein n=1 Tax=Tsuneonella mangrovi TaxID=1982042 RepID=UPI000BA1E049|nr:ThuA domain-containing protein [Tsuneonella mangrovi]